MGALLSVCTALTELRVGEFGGNLRDLWPLAKLEVLVFESVGGCELQSLHRLLASGCHCVGSTGVGLWLDVLGW